MGGECWRQMTCKRMRRSLTSFRRLAGCWTGAERTVAVGIAASRSDWTLPRSFKFAIQSMSVCC